MNAAGDPLAAEIARWSAYLRDNRSTDENWTQVKQAVEPALSRASKALQDGQRSLALLRLAGARVNLAASQYVQSRPAAERAEIAAFESEWARMGKVLAADRKPVSPGALEGLRPAAVRAIAEAAAPQVKTFYDASLEYARATSPQYGLFYIGNAAAQRDFVAFCRTLSEPRTAGGPPLRSLESDLDALETELLAAYRPPASIDRHSEFIRASATLKEARELDQAGLRYGALLRYLQAAQALGPLRGASSPPADDTFLRQAWRRSNRGSRQRRAISRSGASSPMRRAPTSRSRRARVRFRGRWCPTFFRGTSRRRSSPRGRRSRRRRRELPSRWSDGRTRETSPTRQVCWHRASRRSSEGRCDSFRRTTGIRRSRRSSA